MDVKCPTCPSSSVFNVPFQLHAQLNHSHVMLTVFQHEHGLLQGGVDELLLYTVSNLTWVAKTTLSTKSRSKEDCHSNTLQL